MARYGSDSSFASERLPYPRPKDIGLILVKVVSWRVISILLTLLVTYVMTGDAASATKMTVLLHTVLIFAHYGFESAWRKKYESKDV